MQIKYSEKDGIGNFIIDGRKMECIKAYDIKRSTENEIDTVDVTLTISIPAQNFETIEKLKETPVAGTTDVTINLDGEKINHIGGKYEWKNTNNNRPPFSIIRTIEKGSL